MTERLTTEDFANRKRDVDEPAAEYREPVADYEQEPTGYERTADDRGAPVEQAQSDYDQSQYDGGQYDREQYDQGQHETDGTTAPQADAVPQQDRQEHLAETQEPTGVEPVPEQAPQARSDDEPLFAPDEADGFRNEWRTLQTDFVDDPRDAVRRADELVAQVFQSLATTFADHKRSLEGQWQQGEEIDTEELRVALRRYRAFFDRLLSV